jgi:flavin-dependent dehydrogenase
MHSAIVIGAGPAGCIASLILARAGWHVRVIEQHRFPRDKVCGECLSALGHEVLARLGLIDAFRELDPVRITRTLIHPGNGRTLELDLPRPMWGVSRMRFDQWLLERARACGTQILQPMRCEAMEPNVVVRDLATNKSQQQSADWTLLADGKGSLASERPGSTDDLGVKTHFENIAGPRDAIELFGVNGHYGGVAPIEDGRWNVAFSVPRRRVRAACADMDAMFEQIIRENQVLRERFAAAQRLSGWLASPLPRFAISRSWPARVIPLGNAAAAIEPVGGEGMGLAMRSAELAAQMLISGEVDLHELRRAFRSIWRMRSVSCRATAKAVSNPALSQWIAHSLRRAKPITRAIMKLMGK